MLNTENIKEPEESLLNDLDMDDLLAFNNGMLDCVEKDLLHKALFELSQYRSLGTVDELQSMKEWMDYSINDMRKGMISFVHGMREVVESYRNPPKKQRGRPKKVVNNDV